MPMIDHLRTAVETLLATCLADMPPATRQRLTDLVLGVLLAGTVVLRQVATTQRHVAGGTVQAASHERRLRRTLNDPQVEAVPTYTRVVRRILQRLRPGQEVRLLIDESGHSNVVRVLTVALWYRGRAVPLTWVLWPAHQPHDQSYWADCTTLLDQVATILPAGLCITVIGDRAFGCPAFTDLVTARGWNYLVRVQGQTRCAHLTAARRRSVICSRTPGSGAVCGAISSRSRVGGMPVWSRIGAAPAATHCCW